MLFNFMVDQTLFTAPSGIPTNFMTTQTTTSSISLSWNPPHNDNQNGIIRFYVVYIVDIINGTSWNIKVNTTSATIHHLQPSFTYNCTVAAYTVAIGPRSDYIVVKLPLTG